MKTFLLIFVLSEIAIWIIQIPLSRFKVFACIFFCELQFIFIHSYEENVMAFRKIKIILM